MNDLNANAKFILNLKNAGEKQLVSKYFIDSQVRLIADKAISPGKFKKHLILLNSYRAHPITIRALKKDIFTVGDLGFQDLEHLIECSSCHTTIDAQFWYFCPYCEAQIKV